MVCNTFLTPWVATHKYTVHSLWALAITSCTKMRHSVHRDINLWKLLCMWPYMKDKMHNRRLNIIRGFLWFSDCPFCHSASEHNAKCPMLTLSMLGSSYSMPVISKLIWSLWLGAQRLGICTNLYLVILTFRKQHTHAHTHKLEVRSLCVIGQMLF